jgi:hypothetical protein
MLTLVERFAGEREEAGIRATGSGNGSHRKAFYRFWISKLREMGYLDKPSDEGSATRAREGRLGLAFRDGRTRLSRL